MISEYDLMRLAEGMDSEGISVEDALEEADKKGTVTVGKVTRKVKPTYDEERARLEKQRYFDYYDDIKLTPRDDW